MRIQSAGLARQAEPAPSSALTGGRVEPAYNSRLRRGTSQKKPRTIERYRFPSESAVLTGELLLIKRRFP